MTKRSILLFFIISSLSLSQLGAQMITEQTLKFGRVMALIEAFYVDSASQEKLTEKAIREVLKELDPHSVYIPEDELQEINQRLQGSFEGIGIEFNILNDSILVISPMPGGPSENAGLRPGDRIVTIDGENVAGTGITTNGVRERLLGDKGTTVKVGIYRRGVKDIKVYDIVRDELPVNSLLASYIAADGIGYIKLRNFSLTTEEEFNEAIDNLLNEDMRHLVLDLRGNTGGYLEAAIR
ncbi:MAG TPA: S41 family peptidase, partial [Bacteroidales bacterium]|nr:S41 family peptidase [Bacteroidales bacterium]